MKLNQQYLDEVSDDGTSAGGAPAPSPVVEFPPSPSVPVEPAAPVSDSNVDWNEVSDDDLSGGETPPPVVETPKVEAPPVVVPTPAVATETPRVEPVVAPVTPTPAVVTPQLTNEEIQTRIKADRDKFIGTLEKQYAISEADIPNLVVEPEKVLPQLFAKAHMAMMDQVAQYINRVLPQMMDQVQTGRAQVGEALTKFYEAWPELKDPKYTQTVARQLVAYRQANPTARPEDVIHEGGVSAIVALRLPIPERIMNKHNAGAPSATPSGGFSPVAAGSAPRSAPTVGTPNPFAVLAQEDLVESS